LKDKGQMEEKLKQIESTTLEQLWLRDLEELEHQLMKK